MRRLLAGAIATVASVLVTTSPAEPAFAQPMHPERPPKSVATAVKYSAYGTAIPIVAGGAIVLAAPSGDDVAATVIGINLGGLGAVVGPGLGHAYAGRWRRFALGSLARTVGAVLMASGIIGSDPSGVGDWGASDGEEDGGWGAEAALIGIGGAIYLWSAIRDFRSLDASVEQYNRESAGSTLRVRPAYFSSHHAPGIIVTVDF